jgi:DNA primase
VGIGGRVLPELSAGSPAKYVNSPETPLVAKSSLLYGLDLAKESIRRARRAIVVEGYTDVIVAHQYGFTETVAVLGTALGENHIRLLKRFADKVVLLLDGDEAGQRRANEVLELFVAQQVDLRIITLPAGLDPCDFLQRHGAAALHQLLEGQAIDALEHAFLTKTRGIDLDRDVHRASQALDELIGIVAKAPRLRDDTAAALRLREQKALQRLAMMFRVDEAHIRQRLTALRRKRSRLSPGPRAAGQISPAARKASDDQAKPDPWQRELLELLLAHPYEFAQFAEQIEAAWLGAGLGRAVYDATCGLVAEGVTPDFERLMLCLDDPAVKNLLVELDECATAKGLHEVEAAPLVEKLIQRFRDKETQQRRPAELVALRQKQLDEDQTIALLERIRRQEQDRQGISELTDE